MAKDAKKIRRINSFFLFIFLNYCFSGHSSVISYESLLCNTHRPWLSGPGLVDFAGSSVHRRHFAIHSCNDSGQFVPTKLNLKAEVNCKNAQKPRINGALKTTTYDRKDGSYVVTYTSGCNKNEFYEIQLQVSNKKLPPISLKQIKGENCVCPLPYDEFWKAYQCDKHLTHEDNQTDTSKNTKEAPAVTIIHPQVQKDMKRWKQNITLDNLPIQKLQKSASRHYTLLNSQLYSRGSEQGLVSIVEEFMLSLLRKVKLPNMEIVINYADSPMHSIEDNTNPLALFGWCGTDYHYEMMIPTWEMMSFAMDKKFDVYDFDSLTIPWKNKIDKVFWRGGDFGNNGRREFVQLAQKHPSLFDVGFYYAYNYDEAIHGPKKSSVEFRNFFKYKYLMNVDGAAASYRTPFLFAGGSLVFLQESPYYEHIYIDFRPYEHYIPVKRDFSDLLEKVNWVKNNDKLVQRIALNGKLLARRILAPEAIYCYTAQTFMTYAQNQHFKPEIRSEMKLLSQPRDCVCKNTRSQGKDEV